MRCPNRHAFDISREGYINLLREQKAGRVLGDSKEMLQARRAFLGAGHYHPLSEAINRLAASQLAPGGARLILDAGCGEGSYLGALKAHLDAVGEPPEAQYVGMDIAKEAARMAAKRYPDILFIVADTWQPLLFPDGSVHLLLNIFAPRNAAEFARVCAPEGRLLVVIPAPEHLAELRAEMDLLEIEENKEQRVIEQLEGNFDLVARERLDFKMHLDQEALKTLVGMTPSARHTSEEAWHMTDEAQPVSAAFTLLLFRRQPSAL